MRAFIRLQKVLVQSNLVIDTALRSLRRQGHHSTDARQQFVDNYHARPVIGGPASESTACLPGREGRRTCRGGEGTDGNRCTAAGAGRTGGTRLPPRREHGQQTKGQEVRRVR